MTQTALTVVPAPADELTTKQETFAQRVAADGNAAASYRAVFDVKPNASPHAVRQAAYELVHTPKVAARIHELRNAIAEQFVINTAALKLRQYEVATAPPLTHVRVFNCRCCHSEDGRNPQWIDSREYADAVEAWQASLTSPKPERMPSMAGGVGFDPFAAPSPCCGACMGAGKPVVYLADTTQLDGAAAASFKGASIDKYGVITIEQHDAQDAARELHRMIPGAIAPQRSESKVAHVHVEPLRDLTPEQIVALMAEQKLIL